MEQGLAHSLVSPSYYAGIIKNPTRSKKPNNKRKTGKKPCNHNK